MRISLYQIDGLLQFSENTCPIIVSPFNSNAHKQFEIWYNELQPTMAALVDVLGSLVYLLQSKRRTKRTIKCDIIMGKGKTRKYVYMCLN